MTCKTRGGDRIVAALLTVTLAGTWIPSTALASTTLVAPSARAAEIRGSILGADGLTTIAGVTVKAAHMATHQIYTSNLTGTDGTYKLSDLPAGSYDLAVQTPQGLFAADALVEAKEGRRTTVSLAIRADRQDPPPQPPPDAPKEGEKPPEQKPDEKKPEEGKKEGEKPPEPQAEKPPKKGGGFWRSPAGAAIAIVAGAVLVGVAASSAVGDDEADDEPLTSNQP
jgi:hypothetical protein